MMIADLHIHSRYSRATSGEMIIPKIAEYAKLKGLKMDKAELEGRMAQLEDVVHDLDRQVNRLLEAERFRRELESGASDRRSLPDIE